MAISPINISRITQNLQAEFTIRSLRRTQRELFETQARLSSGRRMTAASEDPRAAARALNLTQALDRQEQFKANLQHGDNLLSAADSALVEINDLLIQAATIASQNVDNFSSPGERQAEAEVVNKIREQLQSIANRSLGGQFLFAGRKTTKRPFIDALNGVAYTGDTNELTIRADEGLEVPIGVSGDRLFGALSQPKPPQVDLTPSLLASTRLDDLRGAGAAAVKRGTLVVHEIAGVGLFTVDLSDADTIGDVVARINEAAAAAGAELEASLEDGALVLSPGASAVTIGDTGAGATARSLGVLTSNPTSEPITVDTLVPRVTRLTPVSALAGGTGVDLDGGLLITNGAATVPIDLSDAKTVQDILNAINNAGVYALARINEAGTGIEVLNQVSGTSLSIGENGGTTAEDLGLRTLNARTPLAELNFGRGVTTVSGKDDLRITAKDGTTVDVDLDGALTVGDVIDRINEAATASGVALTAGLTPTGNGIRLQDGTGGNGTLSVGLMNLSPAARDLGLAGTVSDDATEFVGDDVNPVRTDGIIGALIDLERALRGNDTQGITLAGERLDGLRGEVIRVQGIVGARSQAMKSRLVQMEDAAAGTRRFLSQVQDLDFAEAATRLQSALTQLQANLRSGSNLLNLSLLDFLR